MGIPAFIFLSDRPKPGCKKANYQVLVWDRSSGRSCKWLLNVGFPGQAALPPQHSQSKAASQDLMTAQWSRPGLQIVLVGFHSAFMTRCLPTIIPLRSEISQLLQAAAGHSAQTPGLEESQLADYSEAARAKRWGARSSMFTGLPWYAQLAYGRWPCTTSPCLWAVRAYTRSVLKICAIYT